MQKYNIIKLLGIQGVLIKNIKEFENCLEINIYTEKKFVECPSCHFLTNKTHDYRTQRIQHINIGKKITFLILKKEDMFVIIVVKNSTNFTLFFKNTLENLMLFLKMFVKISNL